MRRDRNLIVIVRAHCFFNGPGPRLLGRRVCAFLKNARRGLKSASSQPRRDNACAK
jgi:hypothetical protein